MFNFEKNLNHQAQAVASTIAVFDGLEIKAPNVVEKQRINPTIVQNEPWGNFRKNVEKLQESNNITEKPKIDSNIIDIMMETGTGKTYTYTQTIFELNKQYGIFKFIVAVPTLPIKAGTIDFLKSESSREHFKEQYGKTICLHIVESQKGSKSKKAYLPNSVTNFVNAENFDKNTIQVMIINAGMINSDTMQKSFHTTHFDKYNVPLDAIAATNPFLILDEPHKFGAESKTWGNLQKMKPQYILRYGATFPEKEIKQTNPLKNKTESIKVKDYHNLVYTLTAVDAFNRNLVKGIVGHITEFESGKNALIRLINTDGKEATFELLENNKTSETISLSKNESLEKIHPKIDNLLIVSLNKSTVTLSNGMEMKKGDKINPYSYAQSLQEIMLQKTIQHHFELEKKLLTKEVKIKPLTLFFIDNIEEYRGENGNIRTTVEKLIKAEAEKLLKTEQEGFYKTYLEKTLQDVSLTHGGYFSKDNSEKDEAIEKEINEILHDKQAMLDLENPRRFIFSKWTLREGWDNPNVFQICKLRSSGSEISKLQEVGRGLRLPVNEYGNRVKDEFFSLNYFVDFTESDFIDKLVKEINQKSGAISIEEIHEKLNDNMIKQIIEKYKYENENMLLQELIMDKRVIDFSRTFLEDGFAYVKQNYGKIFEGVNSGKVTKGNGEPKQISIRTDNYSELKELWEKLNEKVILEYKFENEANFKQLFTDYLVGQKNSLNESGVRERVAQIAIEDNLAVVREEESVYYRKIAAISTMKYSDFLKQLSKSLNINLKTLHQSFLDSKIDINNYLNVGTIRTIKQNFDNFLMLNAIGKFSIEYKKVTNGIHPTKLTNENGEVLSKISASDVGLFSSDEKVGEKYFFEELYYDSDLEKTNIKESLKEVVIFTKIPKNSIKIPVAGGKSYSPDFAYVLNFENGEKKLHFIVETKNVNNEDSLRSEEKQKIKHAEQFFGGNVKIEFKTQFSNNKMVDLIKEIM